MELSSTFSTNRWNKSQSATESVGGVVGLANAVRRRVLSTRACRGKIMVGAADVFGGRTAGRGGCNECRAAIDVW